LIASEHRLEQDMTDVSSVIRRYFEIWNETDADERQSLIARTWSESASYADPMFAADGQHGINEMISSLQEQYPGYQVRLASEIDSHNDRARFGWEIVDRDRSELIFSGIDFAVLASDGRLQSISGFIDHAPAAYAGNQERT
jgi:hypothetical protein